MKIKINVTKEILENAKMCPTAMSVASTNCAIALAIRDIFPMAFVTMSQFYLTHSRTSEALTLGDETIQLPRSAAMFIKAFDDASAEERVNMHPFSFEIEVPDSVINRIGLEEVQKILSESKTLEQLETTN